MKQTSLRDSPSIVDIIEPRLATEDESSTPLLDRMMPRSTNRPANPKPKPAHMRNKRAASCSAKTAGPTATGNVIVGMLVAMGDAGEPLIDCPVSSSGRLLPARSTIALDTSHIGREVVVAFEENDLERPIILGLVWHPSSRLQAQVDEERVVITAEREIVLRCGDASVTLTRAGKIILRGTYVLSRSSGINQIKGAAVHIN